MQDTKERIAIMQAYIDGKNVQFRPSPKEEWVSLIYDDEEPAWAFDKYEYRINPLQKVLRQYNNIDEFFADFKVHGPMLKLKEENPQYSIYITPISIRGNWIDINPAVASIKSIEDEYVCSELIDIFEWQDGTPCGVIEEITD